MRNKITAALLLFTVFLGLAACAKAPPDYVGLTQTSRGTCRLVAPCPGTP